MIHTEAIAVNFREIEKGAGFEPAPETYLR
jgi:hypothetical protein